MIPPPAWADGRYDIDQATVNRSLPSAVRAVAEAVEGVEVLDVFGPFREYAASAAARTDCADLFRRPIRHWPPLLDAHSKCLTCDGIHTTPEGSRLLADLVVEKLRAPPDPVNKGWASELGDLPSYSESEGVQYRR